MNAPLISRAWRARAIWLCGTAALGFVLLGVLVADDASTGFDGWVFKELYAHLGPGVAAAMLSSSVPAVSIAVCAAVCGIAALAGHWDLAVLAGIGPATTVLLTEFLFKPLLGRELASGESRVTGVFPSGHESAIAATAWLLVLVSFRLPLGRPRAAVLLLLAVWTVVAALGLVRNFWHYATDTIGAMCLATSVVLGLALLIDSYGATVLRRLRPADRRGVTRR